MKPHISFKRGRWQMDRWANRRTGEPMVAVVLSRSLSYAIPYFRKVYEENRAIPTDPEWKLSREQSRAIAENMLKNNALVRKACGFPRAI